MTGVTQLGYLGIGVKDTEAWQGYAESLLGLDTAERHSNGDLLLRMDDNHHRFALHETGEDDIAYSGWEVGSEADLREIAARLEAGGVQVTAGTREQAERRHVAGLISFSDPEGYACEVFYGPEKAAAPFVSGKGDTGFVAGDQGLGHFVLAVRDLDRAMNFYTSMLGLKVSDYINQARMGRMGFLHCNARHHSLAFVQTATASKRINHFMLQTDSIDPVGRTYDSVNAGDARLLVTMGRHSNDEMVSFYMANPSGFGVEYGWGAREVDDCTWQVGEYDSGSLWGHKPVRRSDPAPRT
jgi:biphenyl-2,3-diol 1,2-dioxygenase